MPYLPQTSKRKEGEAAPLAVLDVSGVEGGGGGEANETATKSTVFLYGYCSCSTQGCTMVLSRSRCRYDKHLLIHYLVY